MRHTVAGPHAEQETDLIKKERDYKLKELFVILLLGGLALYVITGRSIFLRVGMAGSVVVYALALFLIATDVVRGLIRQRKQFTGLTMVAFYLGVELFLTYFEWFCISEMLQVQFFGPTPPFRQSRLFMLACLLTLASVIALFGEAIYTRLRNPGRARRHILSFEILQTLNRRNLEAMDKDQRDEVLRDASARLTGHFSDAENFENEIGLVIRELESLGHNLRLFDGGFDLEDENDDSYLWAGDWESPGSTPLIVTFHSRDGVEVEWSKANL